MTLRVVELFAGIGAQAEALKRVGADAEVVAVCEIDRYAYASYCAIHGEVPNLGDITEVEHLPDCDLLTWSFPCIRGDQMVSTERGLVPIKDVRVGDMVLTHEGRFRKVIDARMTGIHGTMNVHTPMNDLVCTHNHMILTRFRLYSNGKSKGDHRFRRFTEPYWAPAASLTKDNYVGFPINSKEVIPEWEGLEETRSDGRVYVYNDISAMLDNPDFWYLCGRYVADGWQRTGGGVVIAIGKGKEGHMERLTRLFNGTASEERTCVKLQIPRVELGAFCDRMFGHGAENKFIHQSVQDLPVGLLREFLQGYVDGDGHVSDSCVSVSSVSERLIRDLQAVVAKVTHMCPKYTIVHRSKTAVIEGREVSQKDSHTLRWNRAVNKQDKSFYEDGVIWMPVRRIETLNPTMVYDLEVEGDHSFVASGMIVHNCTSVSLAGKMDGMEEGSGTASSLGWEVIRLLRDAKERGALPGTLIMENVVQVHSKRNLPEWNRMLDALTDLGYTNTWWDLNATDFDIPQNRVRCFMVSTLDGRVPDRPAPKERTKRLRDMLEDDVDERYFLSEERVAKLVAHRERNKAMGNGFGFKIADPDGDAKCVTTRVRDENDTLIQVGTLDEKGHECIRRVYDPEGASPTVCTSSGGGHLPKIAVYPCLTPDRLEKRQNDPRFRPEGADMFTVTCQDRHGVPLEGIPIRNATKEGYLMAQEGDGVDLESRSGRRGTVQEQRTQTLKTSPTVGVVDGMRIRRLTPREVWRLMDFSDEAFDRASEAEVKGKRMSETQLYKQAGNSICVGVLAEVIGSAISVDRRGRQARLDRWE